MYKVNQEDNLVVVKNKFPFNTKFFNKYRAMNDPIVKESFTNFLEDEYKLYNCGKLFNWLIKHQITPTYKGQKLRRGDVVVWRNYYNIVFENKVIGYDKDGNLYLDTSSYWYSHNELKEEI